MECGFGKSNWKWNHLMIPNQLALRWRCVWIPIPSDVVWYLSEFIIKINAWYRSHLLQPPPWVISMPPSHSRVEEHKLHWVIRMWVRRKALTERKQWTDENYRVHVHYLNSSGFVTLINKCYIFATISNMVRGGWLFGVDVDWWSTVIP